MEEKQGGVDVSSFMLWEATGDSELNMAAMDFLADGDDDDAHSCSCDYSYSGGSIHADDHGDYDDGDDDEGEVVDEDWTEEKEEEEEEEEVSSTARQQKKASRDSTMEMHLMDEMQRSKLFWEACLAS